MKDTVHVPERLKSTSAVKSAARVLDIIELLSIMPVPLGASDVARRLGMPKSSAHTLLMTLEARGYVVGHFDRRFSLHPSFTSPGRSWVGGFRGPLLRVSRPIMQRLVASTGESALLACMRGDFTMEYVEKVVSPQLLRVDVDLGAPRPLHSTSSGQVLLAFSSGEVADEAFSRLRSDMTVEEVATLQETLQQVRNRGFATVSDAHSAYAYGAAAPIRDVRGVVIAAINVTAPSARFHPASDQVVKEVVRAAASISNELSGNSPL